MRARNLILSTALVLGCVAFTQQVSAGEKQDFKKARRLDTIDAYTAFLKKYPGAKFAQQAMTRLEELEVDGIVQRPDPGACKKFVREHSTSTLVIRVLTAGNAQLLPKDDMDLIISELFVSHMGMSGPDTAGQRRFGTGNAPAEISMEEVRARVKKAKPDINPKLVDDILNLPNTAVEARDLHMTTHYMGDTAKTQVAFGDGTLVLPGSLPMRVILPNGESITIPATSDGPVFVLHCGQWWRLP